MPANRGKQKKLEKQKKQRETARKKQHARHADLALPAKREALVRRAAGFPFGTAHISSEWRQDDEEKPGLVSVLVTRRGPGGVVIAASALVDRTCLGIKNAFVTPPMTELELDDYLSRLTELHGAMEPCEVLVAQSVVYHALDYARSLGFSPHRDFAEAMFGPRPAALLDTPLARPSRPIYISGPGDDLAKISMQLTKAVGTDFSFSYGDLLDQMLDEDVEGLELEDDDSFDEDEEPLIDEQLLPGR